MTNEQRKMIIEARIRLLASREGGNANIIRKLNRELRKLG